MAHTPRTQIRPTEYMLARTTILIVDDEAGPRESLKMILSPAHKVLTADCGGRALEMLRAAPVDLVTIDLRMPGMDGEELMRTIRSDYPSTEIIIITGNGSMRTAVEGLRSGICDYISKPFDVVEVSGAVSRALDRRQRRGHLVEFLQGVGSVLGKDTDSSELLGQLRPGVGPASQPVAALQDRPTKSDPPKAPPSEGGQPAISQDETLEFLDVLAQALERRDSELRKHSQRVGFYADLLAEQLGVDDELREQIRISSFLHDIGKVALSDEEKERVQLRTRPGAPLEEEHAEIGSNLVRPLGFDEAVAKVIRHHHEWWDGTGQPDGLQGDEIPLAARVIAVVDVFDRLSAGADGEALSTKQTLDRIQKHSGVRFDPAVIVAFTRMLEDGRFDAPAPDPARTTATGAAE